MADMMNAREAAFLWGMSDRRVAVLCKSGRIEGAIKQGRNWLIPANTPKPEDRRVKTGAYQKAAPRRKVRCHSLLPLPIGISDYRNGVDRQVSDVFKRADDKMYENKQELKNLDY